MKLLKIRQPYLDTIDSAGGGGLDISDDTADITDDLDSFGLDDTGEDDTPPADTPEEPPAEPYKLKVKYNHEDMELAEDEAIPLIQKGMNYDKAVERAAQEARQQAIDEYIASQGYEWNGNPITTQAEYQMALYEQSLIEKGVSPEEISHLVEEHPEVRKAHEIAENQARTEQSTKEFRDFVAEYPDVKPEEIPKEVFMYQRDTGKDLVDCMRWNENRLLKEQIKTLTQNMENSKKAPVGSVTALGDKGTEYDPFLEGFDSI